MRVELEVSFRAFGLALLIGLAACDAGDGRSNRGISTAPGQESDAANALESLATESGVIGDGATAVPTGSYGRRYDGGIDRLCIVPIRTNPSLYQFGVEIRIGEEENCRGYGTAKPAGGLLILTSSDKRCTITARYEGDRIVLPGAIDQACASLCSQRGSLSAVSFPLLDARREAARLVKAQDGQFLCSG